MRGVTQSGKLRHRHIVIIDDAESIRKLLRISLEAHGATVDTTATGSAGLALCEQSLPDLVVLDLGLPDREGMNVLPRLKRINKQINLPVVVLTAFHEPNLREAAVHLGADVFMTKPFLIDELIAVIEKQIQQALLQNAVS